MLAVHSPAILTAEDATVLQFLLEDPTLLDKGKSIIRRRLSGARVVTSGTIPGDVVTINSRITYQCGSDAPVTALLVDIVRPLGSFQGIIPLRSVIGLSVLGLQEGARAIIEADTKSPVTLALKRVHHQPQRELQAIFGSAASTASWTNGAACRSPVRPDGDSKFSIRGEAER